MLYVTPLLVLAVLASVARVFLPGVRSAPGTVVRREEAPILARLQLHALPALAVLTLSTIAVALGGAVAAGVAVAAMALLVCWPVRYTMTTEGIQRGRTPFRRWTEFGGVARRAGGARLQGISGARGMTVWLAGSRETDETILLLRQLVRGSYKGERGSAPGATAEDRRTAPLEPASATG